LTRRPARAGLAICLLAAAGLTPGCGRSDPPLVGCELPAGATVLAIGDSLTRGFGAPGQGYVEQLQALRPDLSVVNAGIDGERSAGLLARLDDALARHRPAVVLITTGGNDFLRRVPEADTRRQVAAMVDRVRAAGAWPVLFEMPRVSLTAAAGYLSAHGLYADLADATGVHLIRGTVVRVLSDEALKADAVHPNVQGYTAMAQAAHEVLARCR